MTGSFKLLSNTVQKASNHAGATNPINAFNKKRKLKGINSCMNYKTEGTQVAGKIGKIKKMETFNSVANGDVKNLTKRLQTEGLPKNHNQFGMSALCWSVELKQIECMETLLKLGADINERNSDLEGKSNCS